MLGIKFRGKRKDNGEWVYSNSIWQWEECALWVDTASEGFASFTWIPVDPATVGRWTGHLGLYEDDRIRLTYVIDTSPGPKTEESVEGVIVFEQGMFCFGPDDLDHALLGLPISSIDDMDYQVIGTIHDTEGAKP